MATKHDQQTYVCRHCSEHYTAHPATNWMALQGQCWACVWIRNLSASVADHYLYAIETVMLYEGYDIPVWGDD